MTYFKKFLYYFCSACRPNRSRTVRYAFPLVATALAILGAVSLATQDKSYIQIESSTDTIKAGETFSIDVSVHSHVPVNAIDIEVAFPESQIEILGVDTGESVITLWTQDPYFKDGKVYLSGGTFRKGFLGNHLVARINARAIETGLAYIDVADSLLLAGDGSGSTVDTVSGTEETAKLTIAATDGSYTDPDTGERISTLEGAAVVKIITDIDGDGSVTLNDITQFMSAWRSKDIIFDFSGDGKMSFRDFAIILADSVLN